ncbi:hypothetical protein NDU88_003923 [Pleurodeles waltl]|uniref:Uncharacterized protein n=1 Tax=Pleurodeles waltl TaxID=8319 RepID=A0AAV7LJV3_PLEWA|nr:hypothetical protein NDU88_003923 [Pleurodeles waltl]
MAAGAGSPPRGHGVDGTPSLEQARVEKVWALATAVIISVDRRSLQNSSPDKDAVDSAMHSEDCVTSQPLPNVTPQMVDELL